MARGKGKEGNVRIIRQEGSLLTDPGRLEGGKTGGGKYKKGKKNQCTRTTPTTNKIRREQGRE